MVRKKPFSWKRWLIVSLVLLLASAVFFGEVHADVAPPQMPPGANPLPEETTQVRMESETVLIEVRMNTEGDPGHARVTATFHMRNLGTEDEVMPVLFPVAFDDGFSAYPQIEDLRVKVDGVLVDTTPVMRPEYFYGFKDVRWEQFTVRFPVGQEVVIEVSYTLRATQMYDEAFVNYTYVLETGAGWKGTIGSVDIILRLPYPANGGNVLLEGSVGWREAPPGGVVEGDEVRWHFDDLEPTRNDNVVITLVLPSVWQHVLNEEANVQAYPNDGEAWGRLGMYLKAALRFKGKLWWRDDPGAEPLYDRAEQAYERAVTLLPKDPLWHAGYADFLWGRYHMRSGGVFDAIQSRHAPDPEAWEKVIRAMQEFHTAYTLAPDNEVILDLLYMVEGWDFKKEFLRRTDDGYDFLALTATPYPPPGRSIPPLTSTPRPTPTATRPATATLPPSPTVTQSPTAAQLPTATSSPVSSPAATPTPAGALPFCGGSLLFVLLALWGVWVSPRR